MEISPNLQSFLNLGYFVQYDKGRDYFSLDGIDRGKYKSVSKPALLTEGARVFTNSVEHNYQPGQKHIVPLSGGLDSRAILAALLEHTEAANISTITFGIPGAWDFEIGQMVSKKLGIKNTPFDLNKYEYRTDELMDISKRNNQQTVLFHHWPVWMMDKISEGQVLWSGFFGDPVAGSHQPAVVTDNLDAAKQYFIKKNKYVVSVPLPKDDIAGILDSGNLVAPEKLSYEEQLDFRIRQGRYIAPHVLLEGYDFRLPFTYQPFVDFFLSLPHHERKDQKLYKEMLMDAFPKAFSYVTKTTAGLPLNAPDKLVYLSKAVNKVVSKFTGKSKGVNFLNFNDKIREKQDLRNVITEHINDFSKRNILDIDAVKLLNDHLSNKGNYYDILLVLTSLEIHLKTGKVL